jgi:hypothetical protein
LAAAGYNLNVFVNCPFDDSYLPLMEALIFAIHDCGFIARSALEAEDSSEVRIDKIARIWFRTHSGLKPRRKCTLAASNFLGCLASVFFCRPPDTYQGCAGANQLASQPTSGPWRCPPRPVTRPGEAQGVLKSWRLNHSKGFCWGRLAGPPSGP